MDTFPLTAADEAGRDAEVSKLIGELAPVVDRILARACRADRVLSASADDIRGDVIARLLAKLRCVARGGETVEDLEDYVATLTRNRVYDVLRARFPMRARLKNRIRFQLANDARFASWSVASGVACGLAEWKGRAVAAEARLPRGRVPRIVFDSTRTAGALHALFELFGAPVDLDELVTLLMSIWNIVEERSVTLDAAAARDESPPQLIGLEARSFLAALWTEIAALRPLQRTALLLNLRSSDGGNALALFVALGIADDARIAEAAGMTVDELAELWGRLPLDDATIAARIGITRQQVINLRKSARERLRRRLVP